MDAVAHCDNDVWRAVVPHLDQYVGIWSVEPRALAAMIELIRHTDLCAHVAAQGVADPGAPAVRPGYQMLAGGIAQIDIEGVLTKYGSSLAANPGTIALRRMVRQATQSDEVAGIAIRIDSPGGTVAGNGDLAADIRFAASMKPVIAYIEDTGASAAYELAAQAPRVVANANALVGSIGILQVVRDLSRMMEADGIVTHVISTGWFKGAGVPGTRITNEQLGEWQRVANDVHEMFVDSVARGRNMSRAQVQQLADGRVHLGDNARALGLIDAVQSFDGALADLRQQIARPRSRANLPRAAAAAADQGAQRMDATETTAAPAAIVAPPASKEVTVPAPHAASLRELKAAFPESNAEWREACLESGATLDQAKDRWIAQVSAAAAVKDAEIARLRKVPASGVDPIGTRATAEEGGDVLVEWHRRVDALRKQGLSQPQAIRQLAVNDPEFHGAYLQAYNARAAAGLRPGDSRTAAPR